MGCTPASVILTFTLDSFPGVRPTVRAFGKGGKSRVILLVDRVFDALADWLEFRPAKCTHDHLFSTFHGDRIYPSGMQRIWVDILKKSGVETEGVTLHTLRHPMATLLLLSGKCSLVETQQILGHSRLDTTAIYLRVGGAWLRQAVQAPPLLDS